jgi:hypothetical protein
MPKIQIIPWIFLLLMLHSKASINRNNLSISYLFIH